MKVLCVTSWFPLPIDSGATVRIFGLLRALVDHHDVHLLAPDKGGEWAQRLRTALEDRVTVECFPVGSPPDQRRFAKSRRWISAMASGVPTWSWSHRSAELEARAVALAPEHDVVVLLEDAAGVYLPALAACEGHPPLMADKHNVRGALMPGPRRLNVNGLRAALDRRLVKEFEGRCVKLADFVVLTSADEGRRLEALYSRCADAIVPSAVDLPKESVSARIPNSLLWIGDMSWEPNSEGLVRFVGASWDALSSVGGELLIVGKDAPPEVTALERMPGVKLLGFVPDLESTLSCAAVGVAPIWRGGAVKLKSLTMLAAGLAVVATPMALEGIDVEAGRHCLIAESPKQMGGAVLRLLNDPGLRDRLGREGRNLVADRYTWSTVGPSFVVAAERAAVRAPAGRRTTPEPRAT